MTFNDPTSRRIAGLAYGVVAGGVSAGLLSFALDHAGSALVLISYLAAIPLFIAGMGVGLWSCFTGCVVGSLALVALAPGSFATFYLMADAVPVLLLVALAMRPHRSGEGKLQWANEGNVLAALAIYPCILFLIIFAATMHHDGGLLAMTSDMLGTLEPQVADMISQSQGGDPLSPDTKLRIHDYMLGMARVTPAIAMSSWLLITLIGMMAAQSLLLPRKWMRRPAFTLSHVRVPGWIIFAAAITGVIAACAPAPWNYVGLNIAILLGMPFFFAGLAVVHAYAARTRAPLLVLVFFYLVVGIVIHLVLLVAVLGAIDQWVDFRKRFADRSLTKK